MRWFCSALRPCTRSSRSYAWQQKGLATDFVFWSLHPIPRWVESSQYWRGIRVSLMVLSLCLSTVLLSMGQTTCKLNGVGNVFTLSSESWVCMGRRELGCTVHKCRKGLDSWWRFGSGEANVSINDVITEGGKAWEESRVTRKTEVQGGLVQGRCCSLQSFASGRLFWESKSRIGQTEVTKFLTFPLRSTKSCNISWAGTRTAGLAQGTGCSRGSL